MKKQPPLHLLCIVQVHLHYNQASSSSLPKLRSMELPLQLTAWQVDHLLEVLKALQMRLQHILQLLTTHWLDLQVQKGIKLTVL